MTDALSAAWHPAWPLLAAATLAGGLPARLRGTVCVGAAGVALGLAWAMPDGDGSWLHVDGLARPFAVVFALIGGLGLLYGWTGSRRLHVAGCAITAAALVVTLAPDWLAFYLGWEAVAVASFVLIGDGRGARSDGAAYRYLLVHVAGGALLLSGLAWHATRGGSGTVGPLALDGPGLLVLVAFAVNAAVPPLHAWLTDAYPESSPAGAALLSAFTTKGAVYALARVFPGAEPLVWAGAVMTLYGVTFAVLENDIRRLLGYHIVSQVGYMVTGVGLGTPLGVSGAVAHAFCHILYKGLLFMGTGAVIRATGRRRLTDLGGLGRAMPGVATLYMVGALAISGLPLLNGFTSKYLVLAAAQDSHRVGPEWLLEIAVVGTFLSVGLKLPYFAFLGPDRGLRPAPTPPTMLIAMTLTALLCLVLGVFPGLLYARLPHPVERDPYAASVVVHVLLTLAGTLLAFRLVRRGLTPKPLASLDFDRLYAAVGRAVPDGLARGAATVADRLEAVADGLADRPVGRAGATVSGPVAYTVLAALIALGLALSALALG